MMMMIDDEIICVHIPGLTLTPKSGSPLMTNSNKTAQTITSPPIFTSPLPELTPLNTKTNSIPVVMAQNKQEPQTTTSNITAPAAKGHEDTGGGKLKFVIILEYTLTLAQNNIWL